MEDAIDILTEMMIKANFEKDYKKRKTNKILYKIIKGDTKI